MDAGAGPDRKRAIARSYGALVGSLLAVEFLIRGPVPLVSPIEVTLLIGLLAVVAYAAFTGGLVAGLVSGAMVGAYTAHYLTPPPGLIDINGATLQGAAIMGALGLAIGGLVGVLKRRADRIAADALARERAHSDELARANRGLEQANASLQAFTYLVSHDLKEPVRTGDMLLHFLEQDHASKLDDDARDLLQRARRANARLAALIASLLELSRASRIEPTEVAPVDVAAVIRGEDCATRYQELLAERAGKLDVEVEGGARVLATPGAVAQVFGNLVANALRHNPRAAPHVLVRSLPSPEARLRFVVEDDGPGFPAAFVASFRDGEAMPSSTKDGGFGLIIVRRVVARLGGAVTLERGEKLGGAAVRIELPRAP